MRMRRLPCGFPGCPATVLNGEDWCPDHRRKAVRDALIAAEQARKARAERVAQRAPEPTPAPPVADTSEGDWRDAWGAFLRDAQTVAPPDSVPLPSPDHEPPELRTGEYLIADAEPVPVPAPIPTPTPKAPMSRAELRDQSVALRLKAFPPDYAARCRAVKESIDASPFNDGAKRIFTDDQRVAVVELMQTRPAGVTVDSVSEVIGVHNSLINYWERGQEIAAAKAARKRGQEIEAAKAARKRGRPTNAERAEREESTRRHTTPSPSNGTRGATNMPSPAKTSPTNGVGELQRLREFRTVVESVLNLRRAGVIRSDDAAIDGIKHALDTARDEHR